MSPMLHEKPIFSYSTALLMQPLHTSLSEKAPFPLGLLPVPSGRPKSSQRPQEASALEWKRAEGRSWPLSFFTWTWKQPVSMGDASENRPIGFLCFTLRLNLISGSGWEIIQASWPFPCLFPLSPAMCSFLSRHYLIFQRNR